MTAILTETALDLPLYARGKVRDIYDLGDKLLIVATDRISAFDVVLPTGIPDKGLVLTQLSAFWFEKTGDIVPNHFLRIVDDTRVEGVDTELPRDLIGRAMLVRKARRLDVECIVRGYAVLGSAGWAEYHETGTISGVKLPGGLKEAQELFEPIFTPTTKADKGHDENITFEQTEALVGEQAANAIALRSLAIYRFGRDYARERHIIIADTKFEFGLLPAEGESLPAGRHGAPGGDDEVTLIDECLTPDSSRFWPADQYKSGRPPPSFDKQYVRDYLTEVGWDRKPPAPELPADVAARTGEKYCEAFHQLTGRELIRP
ncbi:MAG: phosphoribosylaminoimidazolesuccinocarboxamide synthase [Chloroflexi bacterium]|nr:phosphoribosylaminoimidazolesuccinocarboxamide synthase [Chloroflexota bacterium]